jgi:hypothetical protein
MYFVNVEAVTRTVGLQPIMMQGLLPGAYALCTIAALEGGQLNCPAAPSLQQPVPMEVASVKVIPKPTLMLTSMKMSN